MKRSIKNMVGVLGVLLVSATVQAELKLVVNFEGLSGSPDGKACNGVLGGVLDTQSEATGNVDIGSVDGSTAMLVNGLSSGANARGAGFNGITNPIDDGETGIGFFRFSIRSSAGRPVRSHIGLIADATNDPITNANAQDPLTVPAGFRLVDSGTGFDLTTLDGATVLKAGLVRTQWYNVWIVADHTADTFDLYLSTAKGPGGEATLPNPEDLIKSGLRFGGPTPGPLNGMIFANPAGTGQAERINVDDIWWDGDQGLSRPTKAASPSPANKGLDVPRDVILGWTPPASAVKHNVYFGTSADAVGNADNTNPLGVLVSLGQGANTYDPVGLLEYGRTYHWRIDEVNAAPDSTVFKGSVWSFTVEPYAYPIKPAGAMASSAESGMGPEKTIDGSGLDPSDLHGADPTTMWQSTGVPPNWIQYQFDKVYKFSELKVWNSNQLFEKTLGLGARRVTIDYSVDGTTWTTLADVPEFARAPGAAGYAANTTVSLGGILAKYVKLTINSTWGGAAVTGLSEVRFSHVPVQARAPQPAHAATGVKVDTALDWRPGREAGSHRVFFGTDQAAVTGGTATAKTAADHGFVPGSLNFGTTYYWRVDEVNAVTYPGDVWSFTTQEYAVVDDFESYTDYEGSLIYQTWIDGTGPDAKTPGNGTGSVVGNPKAPFAETTIVHGGKQSMPLEYNNVKSPFYSEARRTFDTVQDWTTGGADTLSLYFRGRPVGFADRGNNALTVSGSGTDIWDIADQCRFVYKQLNGNGSITLRVDSIGNTNVGAKAGPMIRETLDAGSRNAYVAVTPGSGVSFQWRNTTSGVSANSQTTGLVAPYWVRITRTGNAFKAERSPDGKTWTQQGADTTVVMATTVYIGLAVTSHDAALTTTAEISNVSTTGTVTGPWQALALGAPMPSNDPAPLYLTIEDKAGKTKTVVNANASATITTAWAQWRVPLSDLSSAGVNVAAVKKITIGVGDRTSPKAGAAGMLYLDDIGFGHPVR